MSNLPANWLADLVDEIFTNYIGKPFRRHEAVTARNEILARFAFEVETLNPSRDDERLEAGFEDCRAAVIEMIEKKA